MLFKPRGDKYITYINHGGFREPMRARFWTFVHRSKSSYTMFLLNKDELKKAETVLKLYFPQSLQVYGYVFLMNRVDADSTDVLVDQWPDFSVLLVKPKQLQNVDLSKELCIFTKDETSLRNILSGTDIIDWKQYFCLSIEPSHEKTIKSVALNKGVSENRKIALCHMMILQDPSTLSSVRASVEVSSLNESHIALVNSTWKFGCDEFSEQMVRNMILNFPSCCVLDSEGQPVSWLLTYSSCAMGMLYTLPEHRGKGYAKALITILAKKLHSDGYPVYCFIEEENQISYRLFTNLGFTEDQSYRSAWFDFNQACVTSSL